MAVFLKALDKEKEKKKLYERVFDLAKEVAPNAEILHLSLHLPPPSSPPTKFHQSVFLPLLSTSYHHLHLFHRFHC